MAWGECFLSPGGTDEVDRVLDNNDFSGAIIRDIGCGIGGAAVHLAKTRQPKHITGIAIERNLFYQAQALADKNNVFTFLDNIGFENIKANISEGG